MARGDTEFCRVEIDFLANDPRCHRLNDHQFRVYLCVWAMAVHERRTGFRMDDDLWPARVRTLAAWARTTPQNLLRTLSALAQDPLRTSSGGLLGMSKGVLSVLSVERKHKKLLGWRDPYGFLLPSDDGGESKRKSKSKTSPKPPSPPSGSDEPARAARPSRKPQPTTPPTPPINGVTGQTIIAAWVDACRSVRGIDARPAGKDAAAAKRLAPLFDSAEEVPGVLDLYVHDDSAFLVSVGWALWALEARINAYRGSGGWKERGDDRPSYDQPYEGPRGRLEDPEPRDRRGESDFEAVGEL